MVDNTYKPPKLKVPIQQDKDHVLGSENAKVKIVEYGDYQCIHCGFLHQIIKELISEYGNRIQYCFRHFPIKSQHPEALIAARAAEAAAAQDKFWEFHDIVYENQSNITEEDLIEYAKKIELDMDQFKEDLENGKYSDKIDQDIRSGARSGVNGTPTIFINGVRYDGAWDYDSLLERIQEPLGIKIQLMAKQFTNLAVSGGILLFVFTLIALIWSNSSLSDQYFEFWNQDLTIIAGDFELTEHFYEWVNDGLMAIFFFVIGLEIKRELLIGELSDVRKALLPIFAAIGGMVVPAVIYYAFNFSAGPDNLKGWGIPVATDIAFMLVVLSFLDSRVPNSVRAFLTALAIVDDLGAIMVISIFYTEDLHIEYLYIAFIVLGVLIILNKVKIYSIYPYAILGVLLWFFFLESGIHATIAGVLLALTIPSRNQPDPETIIAQCANLQSDTTLNPEDREYQYQSMVSTFEAITERLQSPAQRLEHEIQPWTSYLILPVFALANTGIALSQFGVSDIGNSVTLGIIFGLVIGKPIGILAFSWIAIKLDIAELPSQSDWKLLGSVSCLTGIGFTMSLFISSIAYAGTPILAQAKIGVLIASIIAGTVGFILTYYYAPEIGHKKSSYVEEFSVST